MNEIIKKNGVTFGIILGVISVLFTTAIYIVDIKLFTSWWSGLVSIAISIAFGVVLMSKTKKDLKGVFVFKDAFTVYFIAALIGTIISTAYNYVLFNFIDPGAKETLKEITMKMTSDMMTKFGATADQMKESLKQMAESDNYSLGNMVMGMAIVLVFQAIFGLILAAIFKSKSPSSEGL